MQELREFLDKVYYRNTVEEYLITLGIIIVGVLLVKAFKSTVLSRLKRWAATTRTNFDDFLINSFERFGLPVLHVSIVYFSLNYLTLSEKVHQILDIATTVAITILVVQFISYIISQGLQAFVRRQDHGDEKVKQLGGLKLIINLILWFIGLGFLFDNLGYDLTTVIAGLGIGGIAVALAAQNILGDLFNYFVIFVDRPFEVGDFIVVDDKVGTVEHIGIKTTRVKSLSGEQLVFANSDLANSRIHNYKRMQRRRVVLKLGVVYRTSLEALREIPGVLKSIILEQQPVEFDRAHFASYADSSLQFEAVYYVLDSDYAKHMDIQQAINLRIYEEFRRMGVDFAFPTRTLYLMNQDTSEQEYSSASYSDPDKRHLN